MTGTKYTFRANRDIGRHGWIRLTPAYSVHLVEEFAGALTSADRALDPFCGTGTTALVCANRGIPCVTLDINPFLTWLAAAKTRRYSVDDIETAVRVAESITINDDDACDWIPSIKNIGRWWDTATIRELAAIRRGITDAEISEDASDLLKIGFCQVLMERSRANYRHQSVSLKSDISHKLQKPTTTQTADAVDFAHAIAVIARQAAEQQPAAATEIQVMDAREMALTGQFTAVMTSPPYANRMSYIREVRPHMYWLGFLDSAEAAGNLDWRAIGGTWGRATSNLLTWTPSRRTDVDPSIGEAIDTIERRSLVLGRYIRKYIEDTETHLRSLRPLLAPGARVTYIVGNSRFYNQVLATERIYSSLFEEIGLECVHIEPIRKRTSKRELFEFAITGRAPGSRA